MKALFKDFNGQDREFNVWYPLPFTTKIGPHLMTITPVNDPNLLNLLFWKTDKGEVFHATTNMFARIDGRVSWGLFNEGWYEI